MRVSREHLHIRLLDAWIIWTHSLCFISQQVPKLDAPDEAASFSRYPLLLNGPTTISQLCLHKFQHISPQHTDRDSAKGTSGLAVQHECLLSNVEIKSEQSAFPIWELDNQTPLKSGTIIDMCLSKSNRKT